MSRLDQSIVTLTVCRLSGQVPWECGLSACENGCNTHDLSFVPLAQARRVAQEVCDTFGRDAPGAAAMFDPDYLYPREDM